MALPFAGAFSAQEVLRLGEVLGIQEELRLLPQQLRRHDRRLRGGQPDSAGLIPGQHQPETWDHPVDTNRVVYPREQEFSQLQEPLSWAQRVGYRSDTGY